MRDAPYREIVTDLQEGRRSGATRLVACYQERLLTEAVRVFHVPRPDAEEIVDDVLLAVVRQIGQFRFRRGDGDFHVWVLTVFRNRVRDFMRRKALLGELLLSFDESDIPEEEGGGSEAGREVLRSILHSYEAEVLHAEPEEPGKEKGSEALAVVRDVLDAMESWERVLLRCRALGVPYEEIAQYTGKRPEILRVYHERTRKKFAERVQSRLRGVA